MLRFAAIGLDHGHIVTLVDGLRAAGAEFAGYCPRSSVPGLLAQFRSRHPDVPEHPREALLDDPRIDIVCCAAVPSERAGIAVQAMRNGKDVIVDKPGVTSAAQLEAVQQAVAATQRIFSVCFSERLCVPAAAAAGRLVAEGAIGRVIQTIGMGPHRKGSGRPDWFWDPAAAGGILVDIASHQIDQFLFYTGSTRASVAASAVANFATPEQPGFQDFGELLLHSDHASGYARVDWLSPDGLPTWGDSRVTLLGSDGYIELRKNIDVAGRPGGNHLFISNREGTRHLQCDGEPLPYFGDFVADVAARSETAMRQQHVFEVCRLALQAQSQARRLDRSGKDWLYY